LWEKHLELPSFHELLRKDHPELLPWASLEGASREEIEAVLGGPHGTTILALKHANGALLVGDRLATEGWHVADRRVQKVYKTDEHSAIAISGAAGVCLEMVRLFQTELAHYEKLEGTELSTEGKANKLTQMIRANLPAALQGLAVIPILVGYDLKMDEGRIFKYDVTGGRYEEAEFHATGSGGQDARNSLKKFYRAGMDEDEALSLGLEALQDAADESVGTSGIDLERRIFPTAVTTTRQGVFELGDERLRDVYTQVAEPRRRARRGEEHSG
jgi:proteasome beta subunit